MSTILCALSGIEFKCEHMHFHSTSRESHHPIFDIPAPKLLKLLDRWLDQDMNNIENYLLYLALWNSTGLIDFRYPAIQTFETASIVARNLVPLAKMVELVINAGPSISSEILHLPTFVITPDTASLEDSEEWLRIWRSCYADYQNSYVTATALDKLTRMESILERYIKDKTKDISSYAKQLANWAYDAGRFDIHAAYVVLNEYDKPEVMSSYWKRIIIACAKSESIWEIPAIDLQDLIEHCEEHIYHGDIFAHTLMSLLRAGAERRKNFTDFGSIDLGNGNITFRILDADASVEDANKLACIDSAPKEIPVRGNYPSQIAFLRAKMNYKLAQEYAAQMDHVASLEVANLEVAKDDS